MESQSSSYFLVERMVQYVSLKSNYCVLRNNVSRISYSMWLLNQVTVSTQSEVESISAMIGWKSSEIQFRLGSTWSTKLDVYFFLVELCLILSQLSLEVAICTTFIYAFCHVAATWICINCKCCHRELRLNLQLCNSNRMSYCELSNILVSTVWFDFQLYHS